MAYLGYVLSMPPCKMAQKSHGCPECQYRSCMGLAERNVRLYLSGTIPEQRLAELSQDLAETCPLASCYQSWLFMRRNELPVGRARGIKNRDRNDARPCRNGCGCLAALQARMCVCRFFCPFCKTWKMIRLLNCKSLLKT